MIIPRQLQFVAERLMASNLRPGTADNDAQRNEKHGNVTSRLRCQRLSNRHRCILH